MKVKKVFGVIVIGLIIVGGLMVWYGRSLKVMPIVNVDQSVAAINVSVKVDYGSKNLVYPVSLMEPATVLQALQEVKDLPIETKDYGQLGQLITKIGDVANGQNGKYWQYWLNGEYATVGASQQTLKNGDSIEWKFTNEQEIKK